MVYKDTAAVVGSVSHRTRKLLSETRSRGRKTVNTSSRRFAKVTSQWMETLQGATNSLWLSFHVPRSTFGLRNNIGKPFRGSTGGNTRDAQMYSSSCNHLLNGAHRSMSVAAVELKEFFLGRSESARPSGKNRIQKMAQGRQEKQDAYAKTRRSRPLE